MSKEAMKLALEALENNRQTHYYCEDTWYSCPQHEEGCANDSAGDECICGADEANVEIDGAITALREALAEQPAQQEPVDRLLDEAKLLADDRPVEVGNLPEWALDAEHMLRRLVKAFNSASKPAQRKPLTLGQKQKLWSSVGHKPTLKDRVNAYGFAIEAAHGIGEKK